MLHIHRSDDSWKKCFYDAQEFLEEFVVGPAWPLTLFSKFAACENVHSESNRKK